MTTTTATTKRRYGEQVQEILDMPGAEIKPTPAADLIAEWEQTLPITPIPTTNG